MKYTFIGSFFILLRQTYQSFNYLQFITMKKRLLACLFLAAAMVPQLKAEVTYTCTAGKNLNADNGEGIEKMFDNNTATKYCGDAGDDCWALVTASEPVYVRAYETTTANDNEQSGGRCARHWALYGTNDEAVAADAASEGWVTLSDLDNYPWATGFDSECKLLYSALLLR